MLDSLTNQTESDSINLRHSQWAIIRMQTVSELVIQIWPLIMILLHSYGVSQKHHSILVTLCHYEDLLFSQVHFHNILNFLHHCYIMLWMILEYRLRGVGVDVWR